MSLLDKMLRIAGRYDDGANGQAKAVNVKQDGTVFTEDTATKSELELVKAELEAIKTGTLKTELTGSYSILSTQTKPTGNENDSLIEYNVETGETKVFKYISGDWREL